MKIIFLDFDGVLNSERYIKTRVDGIGINPQKMLLLKRICDETKAKIVLTTSWREHWDKDSSLCDSIGNLINNIFGEYSLNIYDKTEKLATREEEIEAFINKHTDIESFVVLDDAFLSSPTLKNNFIKTSFYKDGLCENDVIKATEILNAPNFEKEFFGAIKTESDNKSLKITAKNFFKTSDLELIITYKDDVYYINDNASAIKHLKKNFENYAEIIENSCHETRLKNDIVYDNFTSGFHFTKYIQNLILLGNANLFYKNLDEEIFTKDDACMMEGNAEECDFNELIEMLKGVFEFKESHLNIATTYHVFSNRISFLFETEEETLKISDRFKGNIEGEVLECILWGRDSIDEYIPFMESIIKPFGAYFEDKNVYIKGNKSDFAKLLFSFFNAAVILSVIGGKIDLPK